MKKRQKRILGCIGLTAVVGMTCLAVAMPEQGASATNSVVDTIQVRVVSTMPDVNINGIVEDGYYSNLNRTFTVDYANVYNFVVTLDYTDLDGNTISKEIDRQSVDVVSGAEDYTFRLVE